MLRPPGHMSMDTGLDAILEEDTTADMELHAHQRAIVKDSTKDQLIGRTPTGTPDMKDPLNRVGIGR